MSDLVTIERQCGQCRTVHTLYVTAEGFRNWNMGRGAYVQDAFPELTASQRELLVSGTCGPCFDALFADVEDGSDAVVQYAGSTPDENTEETPVPPDADPGPSGVTQTGEIVSGPTPAECVERARLGLTAEGEPATRGHLRAPAVDWPRCSTELPGIESPLFITQPHVCNRPATLLMTFTPDYIDGMAHHDCHDDDCPIAAIGQDPAVLAELQANPIPLCAMHLSAMRASEQQFVREVGAAMGCTRVFNLSVIGVESVSLLGGGHPDGACVIDLRPLRDKQSRR